MPCPDPRFTVTYCDVNGLALIPHEDCDADPTNDVVTDNLTGLIWVRLPDNIHRTWVEALTMRMTSVVAVIRIGGCRTSTNLQSMIHNGEPDTAVWLNTAPPYYFIGVSLFFTGLQRLIALKEIRQWL